MVVSILFLVAMSSWFAFVAWKILDEMSRE